jgi:hypothetical protein
MNAVIGTLSHSPSHHLARADLAEQRIPEGLVFRSSSDPLVRAFTMDLHQKPGSSN